MLVEINPEKVLSYDLITGTILKRLSQKHFKALVQIFNSMLRVEYFPNLWKVSQNIMFQSKEKLMWSNLTPPDWLTFYIMEDLNESFSY